MQRFIKYTAPLALAAGSVALAAPAHAAGEPAPIFTFLGQDTETPSTMTELNGKKCSTEDGITTCEAYDVPLAGVKLKYLSMKYNQGKLYRIYGALYKTGFGDILGAFSAKYGNPKSESRTWQNRAGSTFDNPTFIWNFRNGDLELETLGWDLNSSSFEFTADKNAPPPEPPVVDF